MRSGTVHGRATSPSRITSVWTRPLNTTRIRRKAGPTARCGQCMGSTPTVPHKGEHTTLSELKTLKGNSLTFYNGRL